MILRRRLDLAAAWFATRSLLASSASAFVPSSRRPFVSSTARRSVTLPTTWDELTAVLPAPEELGRSLPLPSVPDASALWREAGALGESLASQLLPPDVAAVLCSFLSTRDLVHFLLRTSRRLHDDDAWGRSAGGIWSSACRREWRGRSHVPEEYLAMLRFRPSAVGPEPTREAAKVQVPLNVPRNIPLAALKHSIQDSTREEITKDELCSFAWRFRFRIAAGSEWTSADPFWTNNAPMTFRFCRDGRVLEMQNNRSAVPRFPHFDEPVEMRWRFVEQPRGFPPRRKGGYVRVSVAGSEVPTYEVKRCSSKNWAFVMTSCWGAFSSADFRDVRMEEEEEEEWGAHVKREVEMYNRGIIILPEGNPEG